MGTEAMLGAFAVVGGEGEACFAASFEAVCMVLSLACPPLSRRYARFGQAPIPVADCRHRLAVFVDGSLVFDQRHGPLLVIVALPF